MNSPRRYHSPLREAQAGLTRERILDALADLAAEEGFEGISTRELAARAGIAERTIYRHFADRQALHDALAERVAARSGWEAAPHDPEFTDLRHLAQRIEASYLTFDEHENDTAVSARLSLIRGRMAADSDRRHERFAAALRAAHPDLDDEEILTMMIVLRMLASSRNWLRMRDELGVTGARSGPVMRWLLELVAADLQTRGGHPPSFRAEVV